MDRDWLIVTERWLTVPSAPTYEVSDRGQVRRAVAGPGASAGRVLRWNTSSYTGYPTVELYVNGVATRRAVHSVVAEAFIGPRPDGAQVSHLDGVRSNPAARNLLYETSGENHARRREHGTNLAGEKNPAAKLSDAQAVEIRRRLKAGERQADLAREYGVTRQVVWFIDHRYTWKDAA